MLPTGVDTIMARTKAAAVAGWQCGKAVVSSRVGGSLDGTFVARAKGTVVKVDADKVTVTFHSDTAVFESGADGCWRHAPSGAVLHLEKI